MRTEVHRPQGGIAPQGARVLLIAVPKFTTVGGTVLPSRPVLTWPSLNFILSTAIKILVIKEVQKGMKCENCGNEC